MADNEARSGILKKQNQQYYPITDKSLVIGLDTELAKKAEVFVAEYGVTTFAEIDAAHQAGKQVVCYLGNEYGLKEYRLQECGTSPMVAIFVCMSSGDMYGYSCLFVSSMDDSWTTGTRQFQLLGYKVNSFQSEPDDEHYPSEKLVKDSLDTKYVKPSGGIPFTDLASAVQTSLGKADTALQSFTETDPTVPAWAKAQNPPTEIFWATYGTTTASEIQAAIANGKTVFSLYDNALYVLANVTSTYIYLSSLSVATNTWLRITISSNVWAKGDSALQVTTDRVSDIESNKTSTTKYPTTKAVADYAQPIIDSSHKLDYGLLSNTPTIPTVEALTTSEIDTIWTNAS